MEGNIKSNLLMICKLLEEYDVHYMLVGGTAVALNGYYRHSTTISGELTSIPDIDIWYNPTYENYFNILKVIEALGKDISEYQNEQSPNPRKSFFQFKFDDFTLDILPEIKAPIKFSDANKRKTTIVLEETAIHFMGLGDLIEDKEASARKKDLADIKQLRKIRGDK
jgi:hypothetical protein